MTLLETLNAVDKGYPDLLLADAYDPETGEAKGAGCGLHHATLAGFIVREIVDAYSEGEPDDQWGHAVNVLETAMSELDRVIKVLAAL